MESAFGVDHPGVIFKRDEKRAKHYGRMSETMGALGATSGVLGAGSATVGRLERKGHDPMGFTIRDSPRMKPMVPAHRARVLEINAAAHGLQAKTAGGLAAAGLGVAGAYKLKQRKALSKSDRSRKVSDAALGTVAVGTSGATIAGGGYMANKLGSAGVMGGRVAHESNGFLREQKKGARKMNKTTVNWHKARVGAGMRGAGVKGAGAVAGLGAAGLGAASIYELGRKKS